MHCAPGGQGEGRIKGERTERCRAKKEEIDRSEEKRGREYEERGETRGEELVRGAD